MTSVPPAETHRPWEQEDALDQQARAKALDITRSFIVRAPAGSGKTELLTRRFLALLRVVAVPEDILAITFTRAATAEMRDRVLKTLRDEEALRTAGHAAVNADARAALEQSDKLGWALLEQPYRLNIQTIDSLCLQIAYDAPLFSRLGGQLQPTPDAQPLYDQAARRTLEQLGGGNETLSRALEHLLRLRDVQVEECEQLIASMLAKRDQWLEDFSTTTQHDETDWPAIRLLLEAPFRRERAKVTHAVRAYLHRHSDHAERLLQLAAYACSNEPNHTIVNIRHLLTLEQLTELEHFQCLRDFLLTEDSTWRKRIDTKIGFPSEDNGGSPGRTKEFKQLLQDLAGIDGLLGALCALKALPDPQFSDEQWQTVRSIITVLLHAAAELRVVFGQRAVIDFVEAGMDAQHALREPEVQRRWSDRVHHLLVDEFQDTSRRQYDLIAKIITEWDTNEHRTCFLVGDPMQSIYLFRQADLALFQHVQTKGFSGQSSAPAIETLTLSRNFRSDAGVVNPINALFTALREQDPAAGAHFVPAVANAGTPAAKALTVIADFTVEKEEAEEQEALRIVEIVRGHLPAIERARHAGDEFRVAILVRAKNRVALVATALREAGIDYRAVDLQTLEQRQEIIDLTSLVRALLSPLDRIAWLAILRAPWCGLSLADLHVLSGSDDSELHCKPMLELLEARLPLLSTDGAQRARRLAGVMQMAISQRFSGQFSGMPNGFAAWVERTWTSLGGAQCISNDARQNVEAFFQIISSLTPDGSEATPVRMKQRLARLFARPSVVTTDRAGVQLMTIHKAKGLGFHVVIVPGLDRKVGYADRPLIHWMERARDRSGERELLIAPMGSKGADTSANYKWVSDQRRKEEDEELHRLLYVASTRAKNELHLFGNVKPKRSKQTRGVATMGGPAMHTLLRTGWPYFERAFAEQFEAQSAEGFGARQSGPSSSATGPFLVARSSAVPGDLAQVAASGRASGQLLRRLPSDWSASHADVSPELHAVPPGRSHVRWPSATHALAQASGIVVHALFQQMASLTPDNPLRDPVQRGSHWLRVATALLRGAGLTGRQLAVQAGRCVQLLQNAVQDKYGRWILERRQAARNETAWTSYHHGRLESVRADRVFIAGSEPMQSGVTHLWIVDYKTTPLNAENSDLFLQQERAQHEEQLAGYGRVLQAALPCDLPLRFALYYPSLPRLDWWAPA